MRKTKTEEELESLEIYDDLFASLLNPNRQVAIGEHVFEIDVVNDRVAVLNNDQFDSAKSFVKKKNKIREFNTEDDVLDLVDNNTADVAAPSERRYCKRKKVQRNFSLGNVKFESKIVYQRGGIFKSLIAKIKQIGIGGYIELYSSPGAYNYWKNKKTRNKVRINNSQ